MSVSESATAADQSPNQAIPDFLAGGGELGALMRAFHWAATELGPTAAWPQSLKMAVRIMLTSLQPIWIGWGKNLTYLYNDPYKSIIGSPIPNDDGTVGGIFCANSDDTQRVIGERQLALLRDLAAEAAATRNWQQACEHSAAALEESSRDLRFALIYIAESGSSAAKLVATSGIERGHLAAPETLALDSASPWPVGDVLQSHKLQVISDLRTVFAIDLPAGPWRYAPRQAAVVPILPAGETGRAGVLVVGLSPVRLFDDNYRGFPSLVAGQIAASIASAQAYEEERRRTEALAELDRAKTTFFSNVSHEFRTPLTLMMGPIEDVLNDASSTAVAPVHRGRLETAHRNTLRVLRLVNSLLDFSRIEAGLIDASFQPTDLARLTAELASNFQSAVEKAGLVLRIDCRQLSQPVYTDHGMWEKIVLNLLSNAFKFTFEGQIAIELRNSFDQRSAELRVSDTGVGIPSAELSRLFERFHRIEGQRSRSFEGSGIGLALVQELVKLHGGAIHAVSDVGKGTTFTFSVPYGTHHLSADRIGKEQARFSTSMRAGSFVEEALRWLPPTEAASETGGRFDDTPELMFQGQTDGAHILVADDNADMRNYISRLLRPRWEVETASDGLDALAAIRVKKPDLILSDVMMPRLDGFGLLREIRHDHDLRDIPVIILSARAGEEARVEGLDGGADDYLTKPSPRASLPPV
jgi:signal transduction histidine kinase/CheY-like chemotaxis protein